jgi:hypothetical protein
MPTTPAHSPAAGAPSALYRLGSSSPSTPNRSFISGAFTNPGGSSVSTSTSVSRDSFRGYKWTNGGHVTSTPNSWKPRSRGDDVEVSVREVVGGEVGKVGRETGESKVGVPAHPRARKEGVALKSLPQTPQRIRFLPPHTQLREACTQIVPSKRSSEVPVAVPHPHFPLALRPEVSLASAFSPQRNQNWALPQSALARLVPGDSMSRGLV